MDQKERREKVAWLNRYQECLLTESRLQVQIEKAKTRAESTTQTLTEMPYSCGHSSKVENGAILLAEYCADLDNQRAESEKIRAEIELSISKIDGSIHREILIWRYIIGDYGYNPMEFWKISNKLFISERHVRRLHNEALSLLKICPLMSG